MPRLIARSVGRVQTRVVADSKRWADTGFSVCAVGANVRAIHALCQAFADEIGGLLCIETEDDELFVWLPNGKPIEDNILFNDDLNLVVHKRLGQWNVSAASVYDDDRYEPDKYDTFELIHKYHPDVKSFLFRGERIEMVFFKLVR